MSRNRVVAFCDKYSEFKETKYVIKAHHEYEEGMEFWVLETTDKIPEATLFSKKEVFRIKQALKSESYEGAVDIKINEECSLYIVQPRIITPAFGEYGFGFEMKPRSDRMVFGARANYSEPNLLIGIEGGLGYKYYFKTKEDAQTFCDKNKEAIYSTLKNEFKML